MRLVFPVERVRLNGELEFINADYNTRDDKLTKTYTEALKKAGFVFPGKLIAGKPTILKPFDEGLFLVDNEGSVFHVKRVDDEPHVIKTPIDPSLNVRSIKISENSRKEFYGLLVAGDGSLHLLSYDNYKLVPLSLEGYNPDTMDFKLIINPLFRTALFSDEATMHAVVMNDNYRRLAAYEHPMPVKAQLTSQAIFTRLVPFSLTLEKPTSAYLHLDMHYNGVMGFFSCLVVLALYVTASFRRKSWSKRNFVDSGIVLLTGVYGLVAVLLLPNER